MFVIRDAQIRVLGEAKRRAFEESLVARIRAELPDHDAALGETGVRAGVALGTERAAAHGIVTEPGVTVFVKLLFLFGADFDREHAWASAVLNHQIPADERTRVLNLGQAALEYLALLSRDHPEPRDHDE